MAGHENLLEVKNGAAPLWAICCYFNPVGYRRRVENYRHFRSNLNVPLITVELGYDGRFDLGQDAAEIHIRVDSQDVMWQKERLLNIALEYLPDDCAYFAWLDADVVFDDVNWAAKSIEALQRYPLIQPFDRVFESTPANPANSVNPVNTQGHSLAYIYSSGTDMSTLLSGNMRIKGCNGGLAWVARREVFATDAFYDTCIMGSGNRAMLCAAFGQEQYAVSYLQMPAAWEAHYREWAQRHRQQVGGDVGYIAGSVTHLWHGDLRDRAYKSRHREFREYQFDPNVDIMLDDSGCWRWSTDKAQMQDYVSRYFYQRREDGATIGPMQAAVSEEEMVPGSMG